MNGRIVVGLALAWTALTGCATSEMAPELTDAEMARIAVDELGDLRDDTAVTDRALIDQAQTAIRRARDLHNCEVSGLVVGFTEESDDGIRTFDGQWIDLSNRHMNGAVYGHGYHGSFDGNIEGRLLDGYVAGAYGHNEFAGRWEAVRFGYGSTDPVTGPPAVPTDPDYTDADGDGVIDATGEVIDADNDGVVDATGDVINPDGTIDGDVPPIDILPPDSFHQGFVIGDYSTIEPLNIGYFFGAWAECEPIMLPQPEPDPCDGDHTNPDGTVGDASDGTEPAGDAN